MQLLRFAKMYLDVISDKIFESYVDKSNHQHLFVDFFKCQWTLKVGNIESGLALILLRRFWLPC